MAKEIVIEDKNWQVIIDHTTQILQVTCFNPLHPWMKINLLLI